jgi:prohibitin 2
MILTIILLILTVVVGAVAAWLSLSQDPDLQTAPKKPAWIGFFVLLALTILSLGFRIIPAGYIGVVTWFGEVEDRSLQPGAAFVVPIAESIVEVETRVHGLHFENISAASEEYQDVFLTGTLNIHVDSEGAQDLYQRVGLDYNDKIVNPFFADIIKEIVPTYPIADILANRSEIRSRTVDLLNEKLNPYHITVDDVAIANIGFSDAYTTAIEEKQVQQQRVATERQILEQKRIQADQAVADAEGQAEAAIEIARGEAEANRLLTESLSEELIRYTAITTLSDKISIALVPSDGGLILDVGSLGQPQPSPEQ